MSPRIRRPLVSLLLTTLLLSLLLANAGAAAGPEFTCASVAQIPLAECQALEALYTSTNGAQWKDKAGWLVTSTPCSWYGVSCQAGHVSGIELVNNNLAGPLPAQLSSLSHLQVLDLMNAESTVGGLVGSVPAGLGSLAQLRTLNLSGHQLTGSIPPQLTNLAALQLLNLSNNQLSGAIPAGLGGLANLQILGLNNNQLSGGIPLELANLSNLQRLLLANNSLTGTIPVSLGGLSNLTQLVLGYNQLSGPIPPQLGNLSHLSVLMLSNNRLTGAIPASLGNLSQAFDIWLNSNALSGAVPATLCDLDGLLSLDVGFNALSSAPSCMAYLDPQWHETQTVAPGNLSAAAGATQVGLSWSPIAYQADGGYYEISYRPAGGAFAVHGVTPNKGSGSYTVTGLTPDSNYEFRVRTFTPAHNSAPAFQQNALWSDYAAISARTQPAGAPNTIFLPLIRRR